MNREYPHQSLKPRNLLLWKQTVNTSKGMQLKYEGYVRWEWEFLCFVLLVHEMECLSTPVMLLNWHIKYKYRQIHASSSTTIQPTQCCMIPAYKCRTRIPYVRRTNPRRQVTVVNKFCTVVPNMFGSSEWKLLHVTILAPWLWGGS